MALKRVEKERIKDSLLKLQSVANSLNQVDSTEIPKLEHVQECLDDADKVLPPCPETSWEQQATRRAFA
jgi:hypothetical protein